jgi:hypothetical protein
VIPSVLAITKAPTKTAMPAKARRAYLITLMKPRSFLSSFTWALGVRTVAVAGRTRLISAVNRLAGTPAFDWTWIASSWPTFWKSRWAVGWSKIAKVTPPSETFAEYLAIPEIRNFSIGP